MMKLSARITAAILAAIADKALPVVHEDTLSQIHARSGDQVDLGVTLQLLKRDTYTASTHLLAPRATNGLPSVADEQHGVLVERNMFTEGFEAFVPKATKFFTRPLVAKGGALPKTRWGQRASMPTWKTRMPTWRLKIPSRWPKWRGTGVRPTTLPLVKAKTPPETPGSSGRLGDVLTAGAGGKNFQNNLKKFGASGKNFQNNLNKLAAALENKAPKDPELLKPFPTGARLFQTEEGRWVAVHGRQVKMLHPGQMFKNEKGEPIDKETATAEDRDLVASYSNVGPNTAKHAS